EPDDLEWPEWDRSLHHPPPISWVVPVRNQDRPLLPEEQHEPPEKADHDVCEREQNRSTPRYLVLPNPEGRGEPPEALRSHQSLDLPPRPAPRCARGRAIPNAPPR